VFETWAALVHSQSHVRRIRWVGDSDHTNSAMATTSLLQTVEPDWVGVVDGYLEGAVLFLVSMDEQADWNMKTYSNARGRGDEARINSTSTVGHTGSVEWSLYYIVVSWVEAEDNSISHLSVRCIRSILKAVFSNSDLVGDGSTSSCGNKRQYSEAR
jgi:hypothetical protein